MLNFCQLKMQKERERKKRASLADGIVRFSKGALKLVYSQF